MSRFWVKTPGPGEFRGEGEWIEAKTDKEIRDYELVKELGYLPTREQDYAPATWEV